MSLNLYVCILITMVSIAGVVSAIFNGMDYDIKNNLLDKLIIVALWAHMAMFYLGVITNIINA